MNFREYVNESVVSIPKGKHEVAVKIGEMLERLLKTDKKKLDSLLDDMSKTNLVTRPDSNNAKDMKFFISMVVSQLQSKTTDEYSNKLYLLLRNRLVRGF